MLGLAAASASLSFPAQAATPVAAPPAAQPEDVVAIQETSAHLSATVSPMGLTTAYLFQWGPDTSYGSVSPLVLIQDRLMPTRVKYEITGLQPGSHYHWRIVAANALGNAFGTDRTFTTDGEGPGEQGQEQAGQEATAPPQRSSSAVVKTSKGKVRVKRPDGKGFVLLDKASSVPFGTVIDARRGRVHIETAIDDAGTTQTASFKRGVFEVRQPAAEDGMVDIILRGGAFARRCRAAAARSSAFGEPLAVTSRVPTERRRVVRRLWGSDRHGRFRMHGRNSVATVRGTRWEMVDRCDGTLTRVYSGAVDVRDRRTGRIVRVRPGRPHFNRSR
jgi:hypothetical protein